MASVDRRQLTWPHKIFLWHPNGVYLDYSFLNPVHGHFIDPGELVGAHIREILSQSNSRLLGQAIVGAWKFQERQTTVLTFQRNQCEYQATVDCVPSGQGQILGLVVDALQQTQRPPVSWPFAHYERLTATEQAILADMKLQPILGLGEWNQAQGESPIACLRMGLSNEELAQKRNVTVRTIKAHVTNIYRKLHILSQHHGLTPRPSTSSYPARPDGPDF